MIDFPGFFTQGVTWEILIRIGLAAVCRDFAGNRTRKTRPGGGSAHHAAGVSGGLHRDDHFRRVLSKQLRPSIRSTSGWHPDPARLAAGVLSGMGFLGAGVIIRQSNHMVRGVTTAATLWFVTIIGLAFGVGAIGVGLVATVCSILILVLIPYIESMIKNDWYSDLGVSFAPSACSVDVLVNALGPLGVKVKGIDIEEDLGKRPLSGHAASPLQTEEHGGLHGIHHRGDPRSAGGESDFFSELRGRAR